MIDVALTGVEWVRIKQELRLAAAAVAYCLSGARSKCPVVETPWVVESGLGENDDGIGDWCQQLLGDFAKGMIRGACRVWTILWTHDRNVLGEQQDQKEVWAGG